MTPLNLVEAFGAVPDGAADNTAALVTALRVAGLQRRQLQVPAGVYAYSEILIANSVEIIAEPGATLHALNTARCALMLQGDGPKVVGLRFTGVKPTARTSADATSRIVVSAARGFWVDGVTIESGSGAGIMVRQSSDGVVARSKISDTLADSIHITEWSSYIKVEDNEIQRSGDDGIAVVSYRGQGSTVNNVTARRNRISGNRSGRGMSVVGGMDVLYEHNEIVGNAAAAGLLIAQEEGNYKTFGATRVTARHNTIVNCGNAAIGHYGVMLTSAGGAINSEILLQRNLIVQDDSRGGIRVLTEHNKAVTLDANVAVATPPMHITTPGVTVIRYAGGLVGRG